MIEIFDHSPAISTINYRLSKLSISVLEELLNRIVSELVGKEVELSILDGTTLRVLSGVLLVAISLLLLFLQHEFSDKLDTTVDY